MEKIYGVPAARVMITRLREKRSRERARADYGSPHYHRLTGEVDALDEVLAEIDWCDTRGEEVEAASLMKSAVA